MDTKYPLTHLQNGDHIKTHRDMDPKISLRIRRECRLQTIEKVRSNIEEIIEGQEIAQGIHMIMGTIVMKTGIEIEDIMGGGRREVHGGIEVKDSGPIGQGAVDQIINKMLIQVFPTIDRREDQYLIGHHIRHPHLLIPQIRRRLLQIILTDHQVQGGRRLRRLRRRPRRRHHHQVQGGQETTTTPKEEE